MRNPLRRGRVPGRLVALALALIALAVPIAGATARRATPPAAVTALDVQPFPGTPDASPITDIGFPALAPSQIKALAVTGARSGPHRGRLIALPVGDGTAFLPRRPFTPGERVLVEARLSSPAAGTATGAPGATRISFSFVVAIPANAAGSRGVATARAANFVPAAWNLQTQSFHSVSWLHPPVRWVAGHEPDPRAGDIFTDIENSLQLGPMIFDPQGHLVYFLPLDHSLAFNVEVQRYHGDSVLTYWQGYVQDGVGIGSDRIIDHHYRRVATVYAGHGYSADLHEFQITPRGDALINAFVPVRADLSAVGGPRDGTLLDSVIQEVNIKTRQVLWEWHASGHVHLTETYARAFAGRPFDFFHVNSIQHLPGGKLLISARETWALYEIDMRSGRITLVIGGKHSSLKIAPGANFEWQHDAQMQPDGTITVFDNGDDKASQIEPYSRALRLRLDFKHRLVSLVHAYTNNPPQLSASQGAVEPLGDGNTFVGWGASPYLSEFSRAGAELFSLHFPSAVQCYRALRFQWWGQPAIPPSIATARTAAGTRVYASWNGATDVASWQLLAGPTRRALVPVSRFSKRAQFESTTWVASTERYFAVRALDRAGHVLGTSATIRR